MKSLRQFCAVTILTLTLALSAVAGEIHGGYTQPPPSDPKNQTQADGEIHGGYTTTGQSSDDETISDSILDAALNIVLNLASII